ncbi:acyl-CoA dehydrogenase family protein [Natronosporangium hydrolyticum]|uniref:Acyl-CoA dehydrogenase family protein n=1 Tax=Natronosporangium hydrolyticum TaxID=2811111 RepID=A0A895YRP8_9ACTN|nr:acyl-CoA dehydrogenase family protein [Natronosporangium hydrolyticum]QSB16790.1 acyl-CoA dehydrogenase family protein [Natronosporangium hydrolyticum]
MIEWNADQVALRDGVVAAASALRADGPVDDEASRFQENWQLLSKLGLLGLPFEETYGGLGQDLVTTMYVLEGLGEACRDGGLSFAATTAICSVGVPLNRFGTAAQKQRYLPRICAGAVIGAHAITESVGGSDALKMRTRARRDGDHFVLDGAKTFVSNGPVADLLMIYAATRPGGGALGVTAFLVERDTPGLTVGQPIAKMGLATSPLSDVYLDQVRVPASQVVGRVGGGFLVLDYVMKREVLFSFIVNVGEMRHRVERCIGYARSREQFGQPIGSYQSVANRIVDMKIQTETARKWLYDAALTVAADRVATSDIAIAKLIASEANLETAVSAVRIFGGNGYMTEFGLERDVRNAVAGPIYSGTNEIQYNRIAAMLGL